MRDSKRHESVTVLPVATKRPAARPLRIAQVAPLYESVPPKLYGGTERVVANLSEELAARGHKVTLFASGDSTARVPVCAAWPSSLRLAGLNRFGDAYQLLNLTAAYGRADEFDIIHTHVDYLAFPFARLTATPSVATMHGRLDWPPIDPIYRGFSDVALVSISRSQRAQLPQLNWVGTVHHGLPPDLLRFSPGPGRYLAFLGRISPEKRPDLAIEVARLTGIPLKIAAKVDPADRDYFERVIRPLLKSPDIEFIGEINEREKNQFLGEALALLFPIDWPEPFGLTMIEALACGTPVIARPCGSVPEVIRDGVSGFVATTTEELAAAVRRVETISRQACRREFETRFTAAHMADGYEAIYRLFCADEELFDRSASRAKPANLNALQSA